MCCGSKEVRVEIVGREGGRMDFEPLDGLRGWIDGGLGVVDGENAVDGGSLSAGGESGIDGVGDIFTV
jgi:hypothetical protein